MCLTGMCCFVCFLFCQMKSSESLCRESVNECDLAEYCTGLSHQCPPDDFHMNGIPCNSHEGYCYNGRCPSHLQHCQSLWGKGETDRCVKNKLKIYLDKLKKCIIHESDDHLMLFHTERNTALWKIWIPMSYTIFFWLYQEFEFQLRTFLSKCTNT